MALTSLDKQTTNRLLNSLLKDFINDENIIVDYKRNSAAYGKLELIKAQMIGLQKQALVIIEEINMDDELKKIKCNFIKVPGTYYYCYDNGCNLFLSLISPEEWSTDYVFKGKYLFDHDYIFKRF